jgi:hypothetical protein
MIWWCRSIVVWEHEHHPHWVRHAYCLQLQHAGAKFLSFFPFLRSLRGIVMLVQVNWLLLLSMLRSELIVMLEIREYWWNPSSKAAGTQWQGQQWGGAELNKERLTWTATLKQQGDYCSFTKEIGKPRGVGATTGLHLVPPVLGPEASRNLV